MKALLTILTITLLISCSTERQLQVQTGTYSFFLILPLSVAFFLVCVPVLWIFYNVVEWYKSKRRQAKVIDINKPGEDDEIMWGNGWW